MTIKIIRGQETHVVARDIPVGATFQGTIGAYTGLFLRIAGCVVYLDDADIAWNIGDCRNVLSYRAVDIEIKILNDNATVVKSVERRYAEGEIIKN